MKIKESEYLVEAKSLLDLSETIKNDVAILVVVNVKSNVVSNDYNDYSLKTEFFDDKEIEEIILGFRINEFYVQFFSDEIKFMQWCIDGGLESLKKKFVCVYNSACSGRGPGRKSLIPAFCGLKNIPITNSNAYVVSLCRHKYHFSELLNKHQIPSAKSWLYSKELGWLLNNHPPINEKIICKPTYETASIGIDQNSIFNYSHSKDKFIKKLAQQYDQPMTVQKFISGFEVEVPVMISDGIPYVLDVVGLSLNNINFLNNEILTYDLVYNDKYNFYQFDDNSIKQQILQKAKNAISVCGIEGFGRVDFRIDTAGNFYVIDISTYPHLIKHSSIRFMLDEGGFKYEDIFGILIGLTAKRFGWK